MRRILVVMVTLALGTGCGSSDEENCKDLCSTAQAGQCTAITGDCGNFCAALNNAKSPAGCTSQYDAYLSCLNQASGPCASPCTSQENALSTCMAAYCLTRLTDSDCKTLVASF